MFLATWKDIPNENEAQFQIRDCALNAGEDSPNPELSPLVYAGPDLYPAHPSLTRALSDSTEAVSSKLQSSNIFTIAKRNVEGQDMLYQSLKLTNGIWVLAELRIQPGNTSFMVRAPAVAGSPGALPPALGSLLPRFSPQPAGGSDGVVLRVPWSLV